jgi:hypothetical protein
MASLEAHSILDVRIDGRIRWYLEDYAKYPARPGPGIAEAAEAVSQSKDDGDFTVPERPCCGASSGW